MKEIIVENKIRPYICLFKYLSNSYYVREIIVKSNGLLTTLMETWFSDESR